jgi:hypothetical protein
MTEHDRAVVANLARIMTIPWLTVVALLTTIQVAHALPFGVSAELELETVTATVGDLGGSTTLTTDTGLLSDPKGLLGRAAATIFDPTKPNTATVRGAGTSFVTSLNCCAVATTFSDALDTLTFPSRQTVTLNVALTGSGTLQLPTLGGGALAELGVLFGPVVPLSEIFQRIQDAAQATPPVTISFSEALAAALSQTPPTQRLSNFLSNTSPIVSLRCGPQPPRPSCSGTITQSASSNVVVEANLAYFYFLRLSVVADNADMDFFSTGSATLQAGPHQSAAADFAAQQNGVPFAALRIRRLEIKSDEFEMRGAFTLGAASNGIAPLTEDVIVQVGPYTGTIPGGSFKRHGEHKFKFEGVVAGVKLEMEIRERDDGSFEFKAEGEGANLNGTGNPVTVGLRIGDDSGSTTVTAKVKIGTK